FHERKYHFVYENKTWNESQSFCREHYTDLATIDNMDDWNILNETRAWIGLYDDVNSWRWSMSDSNFCRQEQKEFRNWKSGEPDNRRSEEHCGSMTSDGLWNDVPCSLTIRPVCFDITGWRVLMAELKSTTKKKV
uniref:C-type lectin domain-containing protein n=1 Tax=Fundulus heteroclitus TaxID=8078 RepID=A0A3Q2QK47_FUNHE